jgi:hypothetical protein
MAINKTQVLAALHKASRLVSDAAAGRVSIPVFLEQYGNFYYAAALDGHENEPELSKLIEAMPELVRLHEEIQRRVVDAIYLGPFNDRESLHNAGRVSVQDAEERLREIASRYRLTDLLLAL